MGLSTATLSAAATGIFAAPVAVETREFNITGFDQISISAGIEAEIIAGREFSITADARSRRVLRKLDLELRGNTLYATRDSNLRDWLFGGNNR